ncbi:MAG: NAD-dependent epimerase/dehydratase family protein [Pseudomonadota bacterium]
MAPESQVVTPAGPVVLITGGAGFIGHALTGMLLKHMDEDGGAGKDAPLAPSEIRVFDIRRPAFATDPRVVPIIGDVRSLDALREACRGVDVVLHCAALVDWGQHPEALVRDVNVTGTRNVIRACTQEGVRALVFTSTLDVVYEGRPIVDGDETLPYPGRFTDVYPATKAQAEQLVLSANGAPLVPRPGEDGDEAPATLRTCALRPCGVFGEGDPYHISSFVREAKAGRLLFRIGDGTARYQHVYVGNVARAHVLAARSLLQPESAAAGEVYFITDYPAKNFFDYMEPFVCGLGYAMPSKRRSIPRPVMIAVACMLESLAWLCRPVKRLALNINRFSVLQLCQDFTFSGEKAARELGYEPVCTEAEAIVRTLIYFRENGPVRQHVPPDDHRKLPPQRA